MYPSQSQSTIGTLLRMIQEDQSKSIPATTPNTQPSAPLRDVVQGPLTSTEDNGSSHVVSVRPEGVTQSGQAVTPTTPTQGALPAPSPVVGPVAPAAPAPVAAPQAAPPPPPATQIASVLRAATPLPSPRPAPVATRIQPQRASTPQRSRVGVQIATNLNAKPSRFTA